MRRYWLEGRGGRDVLRRKKEEEDNFYEKNSSEKKKKPTRDRKRYIGGR